MKNSHIAFLLGSFVFFLSCEKIIEPKNLPQQDVRLVVNSIILSNEPIKANISASKSILSGKDYKLIDNAVCQVYENDIYIGDLTASQKGNYTSGFIAKTNTNYSFVVSTNGYNQVNAKTSVPKSIVYKDIERYDTTLFNYQTTTSFSNLTLSGTSKFKLKIIDDVTTKNYYSIRPIAVIEDVSGKIDTINSTILNNIKANSINGLNTYGGSSFDIDDLTVLNGNEIQLDFDVDIYESLSTNNPLKSIRVFIELTNLSEELYKYNVTLSNQQNTGVSLFAEPVLVYTNVEKGMGIVAGASIQKFLIY